MTIKIAKLDEQFATREFVNSATVINAYERSGRRELELIDFADFNAGTDPADLLRELRTLGVKKFTVSSNWSGLVNTMKNLVDAGAELDGMTTLRTGDAAFILSI